MAEEKVPSENWVGQILKELERVFRYLLPGVMIVGLARLSHPLWFCWVCPGNPQHLALLAAIALCVGSTWYVAHRYSLHQLIDWLVYLCWRCSQKKSGSGQAATTDSGEKTSYSDWLAEHVAASLRGKRADGELRHHSGLRSAQVIYMFMLGEAILLFSLVCPEPCSFFDTHKYFLVICALLVLISASAQQRLMFKIDVYAVRGPSQVKDPSQTTPTPNKS
jgi:hypothetical protein